MTKQQLREAIRKIIKQELNEVNSASAKRAFEKDIVSDPDYIELKKKIKDRFYNSQTSGDYTGEVPNVAKRDYYIDDKFKDIEKFDFNDDEDELSENAPAPSEKEKKGPAVHPGTPPSKLPNRQNPGADPNKIPKKLPAKATMKEAEMLKQVIKRFRNKK